MNKPLPKEDPWVTVASVLLPDEKTKFLAYAHKVNPQIRGAHVEDILDMMADSDAYVGEVEHMLEHFRESSSPGVIAAATRVAIYLGLTHPTTAQVFVSNIMGRCLMRDIKLHEPVSESMVEQTAQKHDIHFFSGAFGKQASGHTVTLKELTDIVNDLRR